MRIKPTIAFYAFKDARARRTAEDKSYMVKRVNKDGSVGRSAPTSIDWQHNAFASADAAEARRAELERLNPGSRYAIVLV